MTLSGVRAVLGWSLAGWIGAAVLRPTLGDAQDAGIVAPPAGESTAGMTPPEAQGATGAPEPPRLLHGADAVYPAGVQPPRTAVVLLELVIDATGRVAQSRVLESAGASFDAAALAAAARFEFAPAQISGRPVGARLRYRHRFVPPSVAPPVAASAPSLPAIGPAPAIAPTSPARDALTGVTVRGERARREVSRLTLDRAEIVHAPGALNDALRGIQNLPGLARAPFVSGSLIVRGSAPGDTQVLVDGTTLPVLYHFGALGSTIPTGMLDRIDFYPSNFSTRFGRATGGVVDVGLRAPRRRGASAQVGLGLLDASALVDAALTPTLSVAVGARYAWGGYLASPVISALTDLGVFIGYWDYQGVLEWRPSPRDRVRVALLGSSDTVTSTRRVVSLAPDGGDWVYETGFALNQGYHLAQVSYAHEFASGTSGRVMVSGGWTGLRFDNHSRSPEYRSTQRSQLDAAPITLRGEISHALSPAVRVHLGVDALGGPRSFQPAAGTSGPGMDASPRPAERSFVLQPGVYVEAEITPVPALRILPGLRADYSRASGESFLVPRLAARWSFAPRWTAKGGLGYFVQPPITERVTLPPELVLLTDRIPRTTTLRSERALHASVGLERELTRCVSVSLEGYYKSIENALVGFPSIDLAMAGESGTGWDTAQIGTTGLGRAYGLELLVRHRLGEHFFGWIAYTLSRAERRDTPASGWRPFEFDQTHNFVALGSYDLGDGWEVGARFRYVTGRPTARWRVAFDTTTAQYVRLPDVPFEARVPDFHQLDLRVEKRFRRDWGHVALFLEVLNVYNQVNAEQYSPSPDLSERRPNGPYVPFFPNLGLRGEL